MNKIDQILAYVKSITERLNAWAANAKKVEELPEMETVNSEALMMVSELEEGVWTSKKLEIQKIIDGISLAGQNNTVREVLLGEITAEHDLEYLFDNNAISVSPTELVILIVFQTISSKQIQRQFLWKLGKGDFAPIGSADLPTKVLELQPKYINEIIADELISAPDAIVYDFGTITDSIIDEVNAAILAFDFTDDEKIYYLRFTQDDIKYLYNFVGTNGSYGDSELQMDESDLVLVYSSEIADVVSLIQSLSNFYLSETTNDASGNKSGSIYRPGKLGVGTSPLLGKLEILIDNLYSTNVAGILNGVIGFGNDSSSGLAPTIFSRSNNSIGLSFISGTNDTNGTDDMRWDIRQNDNTDFDTMTGGGFRWTRYNVNLMQLFRTGVLKIFSLAGTGSRIVEADSTGVLSATRSLDDYYTKTEVDSKVSAVYRYKGSVANFASLPSTGLTIGDVYNTLATDKNYAWTGSAWDDLGGTFDISGKEDTSNKTDDETTSTTSSSKYFSVKGFWNALLLKLFPNAPAKGSSLVDADLILAGDSSDSFKTKTRTFAQLKTNLQTFFNDFYKTWILGINPITGITYTVGANDYKTIGVFSNTNPVAFTVPTNASVAIPIGTSFEYSVQGAGTVTVGGAGITFVQKNLVYSTGNAFVLKKIDIDTWVVDGNPSKLSQITDDVGVMPNEYGVVYLSSSGNDSTALLNNPNRPYLTLDSAMNAVRNNANINVIKVLSSTTFSTTVKFPQKNVIIKSDVVSTLNFNAIGNGIDSGGTSAWTIIDCPNGIVNFTPASATLFGTNTGSDRVYLRISCYNMTISNFSFSNINVFNLNVSNVLTFSGTFIGTLYGGVSSNSIIKLNRVTSSAPCTFISQCATFGGTVYISFNSISTTSTFSLITVGVATIDHGNFTSTNATAFSYLGGSNSGSSFYIDFKNDATIDGKIQIGSFNSTLYISFKGNVTFTTTDSLFANQKSVNVNIIISNARFILPGSIMGGNRNGYEYLEIVNSYLEIGGVLWAGTNVGADVGSEPTKPTVRFKGVNTVKTGTDGATIVGSTIFSTFHPYVEIWGKLYSNGIIQSTIPVNKYTAIVEI